MPQQFRVVVTMIVALAGPAVVHAAPDCSGVLTPEQREEFHSNLGRPHLLTFDTVGTQTVKRLTEDETIRLSSRGRPYLMLGRARIPDEAVPVIKRWLDESAARTVPGWKSALHGVIPPEPWFGLPADDFIALQDGNGTAGRLEVADLANTVSARAAVGVTVHVARSATGRWKFLWSYLYQSNHGREFVLTPLAICAVDVMINPE